MGALDPCIIYSSDDPTKVILNNDDYSFLLKDPPPGKANPSLWRQSQLCYKQGLFEVVKDGVYQVCGHSPDNIGIC